MFTFRLKILDRLTKLSVAGITLGIIGYSWNKLKKEEKSSNEN
jgi:hypothetical protein